MLKSALNIILERIIQIVCFFEVMHFLTRLKTALIFFSSFFILNLSIMMMKLDPKQRHLIRKGLLISVESFDQAFSYSRGFEIGKALAIMAFLARSAKPAVSEFLFNFFEGF